MNTTNHLSIYFRGKSLEIEYMWRFT